ncbi:uncharacterized protein JN550_006522 [Neoarthrinium moseri]|uniref:uncharacterized protein n=1 Tax=Neoarthrinium moseri TaxID=1658444 RepID=UPI001FDC58C6|nr:uncharacterized protein JN550_006522 [Neoarthrinium moseri]KAI1868034.1 hypothetical protein JN550_006522 [Neoarthrinium moseri]
MHSTLFLMGTALIAAVLSTGSIAGNTSTDTVADANAWSIRLFEQDRCSGRLETDITGSGVSSGCRVVAPPSYISARPDFVNIGGDQKLEVRFYHSMDCSTNPIFSVSNGTDPHGCWTAAVGEGIWSYDVKEVAENA